MKKQKGILLILLFSLVLFCVGCSSSKQSNTNAPATSVSNTNEKTSITEKEGKDTYNRADKVFKYKDWIYYYTTRESTKGIYRVKNDGSSKEFVLKPNSRVQSLLVTDKYIYYIDGEGASGADDYLLMKYDLKLKKAEQVAAGKGLKFGMSGNFIYLADGSIKKIDALTNDVIGTIFSSEGGCQEIYNVKNNEITAMLYSNSAYVFSKIKTNEKFEVIEKKIMTTQYGFQPHPCDGQDFIIGESVSDCTAYKLPFKDIFTIDDLTEGNMRKFEKVRNEQNFEYVSIDNNKSFYVTSSLEKPEDRKIVMCDINGNNPKTLAEGKYFGEMIVKDNCIFLQNGTFIDDVSAKGISEKTVDIDGNSYHIFVIDRHLGF